MLSQLSNAVVIARPTVTAAAGLCQWGCPYTAGVDVEILYCPT